MKAVSDMCIQKNYSIHEIEDFTCTYAQGLENHPDVRKMREEIFVVEQGFLEEFDEIDELAEHFVLYEGRNPVAIGRVYVENKELHIGRIAVAKKYRGRGIGTVMMKILERYASEMGWRTFILSAQTRAVHFYHTLGYEECGGEHYEEFCPHVMMKKNV